MARGNAIISTKTEGGKFLVNDESGFTFEYGNEDELRVILKKLIEDKKLRKAMQNYNIKKAKEFLWPKIAEQIDSLYKTMQKPKAI